MISTWDTCPGNSVRRITDRCDDIVIAVDHGRKAIKEERNK